MSTGDLPTFAAKGERQKLDRDWIKLLHEKGLSPFLPGESGPPAKLGQAIREFNQAQYWQCRKTWKNFGCPKGIPCACFTMD